MQRQADEEEEPSGFLQHTSFLDTPRHLPCVEEKTAPAVTIQLQNLQISVEKALTAMWPQGTAMHDKKLKYFACANKS